MKRVFISCGETSGDRYAAELTNTIQSAHSTAQVLGNGGDFLATSGAQLICHVVKKSTIGFIEPLMNIPYFLWVFWRTKRAICHYNIDTVIIIDHQGFNIPLAKWCSRRGIRVIAFVAPQFWLWGNHKAAKKFVGYCYKIACIFNNEYDYYRAIAPEKTIFVGHPLPPLLPERKRCDTPLVIGLFPGSRSQEITQCLQLMLGVVRRLMARYPQYQFKMAVASEAIRNRLQSAVQASGLPITIVTNSRDLIAEAHASLVVSGTVSLEHALVGTPCVVMYRLSWVSYWITRWFILKKLASNTHGFIALPNILAKKAICPEFLQGAATLDAIESAMISLMGNNSKKYNQMVSDFSQIKTTLITDDSTYSMVVGLL